MDFAFDESQQALVDLTAQIVGGEVDHASLRSLAEAGERVDRLLWRALADAGIVGACLPESHGGAGLDLVALAGVCEVLGEHAAAVPYVETVAAAGLTLAAFAPDDLAADVLGAIATGDLLATAALVDPPDSVTASPVDGGHRLDGTKGYVPAGLDADGLVVPADTGVFWVPADADGLHRDALPTTTGVAQATLRLDGVIVPDRARLDGDPAAILAHARLRTDTAICALVAGHCAGALALAADYAKVRHQFDRPIATFQAVSQRAADAYVDTEAVRLTARQAAWRLAAGLPAEAQVATARWWAGEGSHRVVHAATHLHGGVGVDRDYPLHRHFLAARQLELTLGTTEDQLVRLGDLLAD